MVEDLRVKTKIAKALAPEYTYKDFSGVLDINYQSFLNWLNGQFELSYTKARKLNNFINDLIY